MPVLAPIDVNNTKGLLQVETKAIEAGRVDKPSSTDRTLDNAQLEIVNEFATLIDKAAGQIRKEINAITNRVHDAALEIETRSYTDECKSIPGDALTKAGRLESEVRTSLEVERREERLLCRELNYFREANKLTREARYPDSRLFHWSLLGIMIIFESAANAYFFAEASPLGLIGGWYQAVIISLFLVLGSAYWGANGLPLLTHVNLPKKILGSFWLLIYTVALLGITLSAAHLRMFLEKDPDHAFSQAINHLLQSPFGIDSFNSWLLFWVGLLFGIMAAIDGFTSDDSYPHYGDIHRRYREALQAYAAAKGVFVKAANDIFDDSVRRVEGIVSELNQRVREHMALLPQIEALRHEYNDFAAHAEAGCNSLLRLYRERNTQVRSSQAPEYFEKEFSFGNKLTFPEVDLDEHRTKSVIYRARLDDLIQVASQIREELRKANEKQRARIFEFFSNLEKSVDLTLNNDQQRHE